MMIKRTGELSGSFLSEVPREKVTPQYVSAAEDLSSGMRIAVVHEWLATYAGSEMVLAEILSLYPQADLFAVVDFLPPDQRGFLADRKIGVSFIQHLPLARRRFRWYLPLMPFAMEQIDLSNYDLIISNSHAVSKGVLTSGDQLHISYVHTPIRYAWDLHEQYLSRSAGVGTTKSAMARVLMHYLRMWDLRTATGVDHFVANSEVVARRIMRTYRRPASVLYPPVDIAKFPLIEKKENFYVTVARLVPYKRVDLLVEAFSQIPKCDLMIIGAGPELAKLRRNAPPNVHLKGYLPNSAVREHLARAKAFVHAGEEDFGISMVEAQACGTPVLAFVRGGASEIVVDGETGLLFHKQTPEAIVSAISEFESDLRFEPARIRRNAMRFDVGRFRDGFRAMVNDKVRELELSTPFWSHAMLRKGGQAPGTQRAQAIPLRLLDT
jgi:glycosyltransferase involved in cell wall biosynthesis